MKVRCYGEVSKEVRAEVQSFNLGRSVNESDYNVILHDVM